MAGHRLSAPDISRSGSGRAGQAARCGREPPKSRTHHARHDGWRHNSWRLQEALERKRLALQENALGLLPEQVLVIDTVGLDAELSMCFLTSHEWRNRQAQKDYDA